MSKAYDYIKEHTRTKVNHLTENFPWITTNDAQKAVEIAREEIYKWLEENAYKYSTVGFYTDAMLTDLKQAIKDE